ncbi:MAG TPA: Wzz/FepE/Etk N-terminal domain-containing protein [Opitutaceae bacterium]|nr:Wzz/FepE/Etk N-terminal domain-containing protein [Opitutaceae bacterium]
MNDPQNTFSGPGMTLGDIYYVLFRHKWKIILCAIAGALAARGIYMLQPPPFQSEAKLFIRYVTEGKAIGAPGDDMRTKSPDRSGETIINSEVQILTSLDLARQVAEIVGPEKILAKLGGGKDLNYAAAVIQQNLKVAVPPQSSVINVIFAHPDATIVQPVLTAMIDAYLKKHVEIHEAVGIVGDFLTQETDQLRSRLAQTEEELRKARNKAGIISLEDSKKAYTEQIARIRQEIFSAEAELAERSASFQEIAKRPPPTPDAATPKPAPAASPVPPAQADAYRLANARIESLRKREQELLNQFTEESTWVRDVRAQLADAQGAKQKLESQFPQLAHPEIVASASAGGSTGANAGSVDLAAEAARLTALQSKIKVLNAQLDGIRSEAASVDQMEGSILDLRRKQAMEEANYKYYANSLEQARIDEALGAGRVSNISQIQMPSPPFTDRTKINKLQTIILAGGILGGLAWAFLIELFLDRSVKRPIDVERLLRIPLFLSIPDLGRNGHRRLANGSHPDRLALPAGTRTAAAGEGGTDAGPGGAELVPDGDRRRSLHPFQETLRDRLIGYFERRNLTHKPKLVAVTGLAKDAGVTTIAAGLAGCLSDTGDGNVLLVDMTPGQGSAQQFYRGKPVCGLDQILATRDGAQVQDKLYVVSEEPTNDKLSRILPQRFTKLVPKLKASDFDYIIFDMPPVSQISVTPRLAGFMDMVLLVLESEKTDRDIVQRATNLLAESKAHVGVVLNKTRSYVPSRLHQEFLGEV